MMSCIISSLASSGKYLARNLNRSGVSLAMSCERTFLFSLSHVTRFFVSLYCRPKYQISLRPIVLTTFFQIATIKLKPAYFFFFGSNSQNLIRFLFFTQYLIHKNILKKKKRGRTIPGRKVVCQLWYAESRIRVQHPWSPLEHLPVWLAFFCFCLYYYYYYYYLTIPSFFN